MSSYFPMNGFKETVCASTGDYRHNCALSHGVKFLVRFLDSYVLTLNKMTLRYSFTFYLQDLLEICQDST